MLASRSIDSVMMRVMSAWNAKAIRSNISLKCSVMSLGTPTGASGTSRLESSCLAAICTRRSISRTESR